MQLSYRAHRAAPHLEKFQRWAFTFWSYTHSNMRARTVTRVRTVVFTRPRSPTNSKLVGAIPDVFGAGLPAPETNLRGIVSVSYTHLTLPTIYSV